MATDTHRTIDAVWRMESARLIAGLTRIVRDVGVAEDLAQGYTATAGGDWMRPALCEDALRLGRIVAGLVPEEPEVHGLVALMEIQASRARARVGPSGEPVLLLDQDRGRWDQMLIRRGLASLERAEALGGAAGPYALQAAIAACHARARTAEETDWKRIASLYDALAELVPSPVVALNRAVAVGMGLVRRPVSSWSMRSLRSRSWRTITYCPPYGATSWPSWGAPTRHERSSSGRHR